MMLKLGVNVKIHARGSRPVSLGRIKARPVFPDLYSGFARQFANELRLANAPIKTLDLIGEYHSTDP
jgi:hypothetical protein